jgi:hypothetical protein
MEIAIRKITFKTEVTFNTKVVFIFRPASALWYARRSLHCFRMDFPTKSSISGSTSSFENEAFAEQFCEELFPLLILVLFNKM